MTVVVAITIFGSTFSVLCGQAYVPFAAAKDRIFFRIFCRESSGTPTMSLFAIICLSGVWCFFSLDLVIKGLVTIVVFVQFMGQAVGLLYYRWRTPREKQPKGFRMPLYPLPVILQLSIFFFIWITTDSWLLWGSEEPVLEMALCWILLGIPMFLIHARVNKAWPFFPAVTAAGDLIGKSSLEELEREDSLQVLAEAVVDGSVIKGIPLEASPAMEVLSMDLAKMRMGVVEPSEVLEEAGYVYKEEQTTASNDETPGADSSNAASSRNFSALEAAPSQDVVPLDVIEASELMHEPATAEHDRL